MVTPSGNQVQDHGGFQIWPTLMAGLAHSNLSKYKKTGAEFQVKTLAKGTKPVWSYPVGD
jgi:hypothetical protein